MNQYAPVRRAQAGFSLMELLVALVILALVMGIVAPQVIGYLSRHNGRRLEHFRSQSDRPCNRLG